MSPFPAPNLLLRNKWKKEDLRRHQEKLMTSRTRLDTKPPSRFLHLCIDLKRMQKEEEYQATVDYENRILLQKLSNIMRNPGRLDNWNDYEKNSHRTLNNGYRERMKKERCRENHKIVQRLSNVKPIYDVCALEDDYQRHRYIQGMLAETTKDYEINGDGRKTKDQDGRTTRLSPQGGGASQSDLASQRGTRSDEMARDADDEDDRLGEVNEDNRKAAKPKPKPKTKQRAYELDEKVLTAYILKNSVQTMADNDARLLNKIVQNQTQPNDIYIRTLVRRKHFQRMKTKKKYKEVYDTDLESKLREALPKSYETITEVLLDEADDLYLQQIHNAIQEVDAHGLVDMIMLFDPEDFSQFVKTYKKKFGVTMVKDIDDHFNDDVLVAILQSLTEAFSSGDLAADATRAAEQVDELEEDEDPLAETGTIMRALREHGPFQLKQLDKQCLEIKEKSLADLLCEKCESKKAVEVLSTVIDNLNKNSHLKNKARFLYTNMGTDNKNFIQELVALSEMGIMDQVQKEYRRNYKSPLLDDIAKRCRGDCTGIIMAMAENKYRPLGKSQKVKTRIEIVNPPRRAPPDRFSTIDSTNPLNRPSHRYYADIAQSNFKQFKGKDASSVQGSRRGGPPAGRCRTSSADRDSTKDSSSNLRGLFIDQSSQGDSRKRGTVAAKSPFNPDEEAKRAHETLQVVETASSGLGAQLSESSNQQRQTLRKKYKELYGQDLKDDALEVAPTSEWRCLLTALFTPTMETQAEIVRGDLTSNFAIAVLLSMSDKDVGSLNQKYKKVADGNDLFDDLSGHSEFGKLLSERLTGKQEKSFSVNEDAVHRDAETMNSIEGTITLKNEDFCKLMKKSSLHICQTFELLGKMKEKSVREAIDELFEPGDAPSVYALVQSLGNSAVVYANLLSDSLENRNHDLLISVIVTRSEIDLAKVKSVYSKVNNSKLYDDVKNQLGSSDWKETLLNLIKV